MLLIEFSKSKHRGPDNTHIQNINKNVLFGFHRLCINDQSKNGNQPFQLTQYPHLHLICNGEIYNYKELAKQYNCKLESSSDCEIILHLYEKLGLYQTLVLLDGVFAFVIYDSQSNTLSIGRDPFGIRSLYIGTHSKLGHLAIASELKSIYKCVDNIQQFPNGSYCSLQTNKDNYSFQNLQINSYYDLTGYCFVNTVNQESKSEYVTMLSNLKKIFTKAVQKRLLSDRPVGCLLSGGLDSSLVTALVAREFEKQNKRLHTFSIGLQGSEDLKYAQMVANHLNTIHHEVIVSEAEMFTSIEQCIYQIESYDTTTVRASTPMFLLCKYIKENTDITVIYSGEGADEASGSYLYFQNAPSNQHFQEECVRLLKDLPYFDVLRSDKSTAGAGLEVRVPFLDKDFIHMYMSIPTEYKTSNNKIEKELLRNAFKDDNLLPEAVLWRKKEAFSDGCSSKTKSWYQIIQENVDKLISDEEFKSKSNLFEINPPQLKESYYYRILYENYYSDTDYLTPYYWLPKWCGNIADPSARVLNDYD